VAAVQDAGAGVRGAPSSVPPFVGQYGQADKIMDPHRTRIRREVAEVLDATARLGFRATFYYVGLKDRA
jgi:hypothetical protein